MEQPQRGVRKHHTMLIRCLDTFFVHDTSTRRCQILDPTLPGPVHIVWEGEECITRAAHTIQLGRPLCPLLCRQRRRHYIKLTLPLSLLSTLEQLTANEKINRIGFFCTLDAFFEREGEDTRVVTEPPIICFGACEASAVNTGLLTCT